MATRKKHIRTPYEDERKKHRAAASRLHSRFQNLPGLPGGRSELNHSRRVWT